MRNLPTWIQRGLLGITLLGLTPGCAEEVCTQDSPYVEMDVSFSGFPLASASRIELETRVRAPDPVDVNSLYLETRRGSLAFPPEGLDDTLRLLIDPGAYIASLADESYHLTFIVRVYGTRGGTPNLLLAEGRYTDWLMANGCHIALPLEVNTEAVCEGKEEGEPCVGSGSTPAVCVTTAGTLSCVESTCGDGFTDNRQGELCDPGQTVEDCNANCIPMAIDEIGSIPGGGYSPIENAIKQDSEVRGLFDLAFSTGATPMVAGTLLIADFDGDGADEIAWGAPEGFLFDGTTRAGKVILKDHPLENTESVSATDNFATVFAPDRGEPTWLGASLAAGDVNGDGVQDLLMGAPNDNDGAGTLYVVYGGAAQQLSPNSSGEQIDLGSGNGTYQEIRGEQGQIADQPGDHLGYALATGDFDGDGITDLAVGAPGRSDPAIPSRGAVYLLRGGQSFWQTIVSNNVANVAGLQLTASHGDAKFGVALAAGDLDGDGHADLVIGSEVSGDSGASDPGYGAAYVLFGSPNVFDYSHDPVNLDELDHTTELDWMILAAATPDARDRGIGGAVSVGDLDGDGLGEIALTLGRRGSAVEPHTVVLVPGTAIARFRETGTPPNLVSEAVWLEGTPEEAFGAFLLFTDVNRDGTADLLIGAPHCSFEAPLVGRIEQAGALYVLLGSSRAPYWQASPVQVADAMNNSAPVQLPWIRLLGGWSGEQFGTSAAASPHLGQVNPEDPWTRTYILAPGWNYEVNGYNTHSGRVRSVAVGARLPCGRLELCVPE